MGDADYPFWISCAFPRQLYRVAENITSARTMARAPAVIATPALPVPSYNIFICLSAARPAAVNYAASFSQWRRYIVSGKKHADRAADKVAHTSQVTNQSIDISQFLNADRFGSRSHRSSLHLVDTKSIVGVCVHSGFELSMFRR
jgi:hypothetical protein